MLGNYYEANNSLVELLNYYVEIIKLLSFT